MNVTLHSLTELEVPQGAVKEALRAVLHSILFSRALGPVTALEQRSPILGNFCYVKCGDVRGRSSVQIDKTVEESIEQFCHSLSPVGPELARGRLVLSFYERRTRKTFLGMSTKEKVYWEQWSIPVLVNCTPRATGDNAGAALERERTIETAREAVTSTIFHIVELVNERSDHIPPTAVYNSDSAVAFPFEISVPRSGRDAAPESWIKNLLHNGPMAFS